MNHFMTVFGTALLIVVIWLSGLFCAPYLVEKMFPKWCIQKKAAVGVVSYLILTGLILVIIGQSL